MKLEIRLGLVIATILAVQILDFENISVLAIPAPPVENALRYLEELDKFYTQKGRPR